MPETRDRTPAIWWWPATIVLLALAGFFPTYFTHFPEFAGTSVAVHFHVLTMAAWLGLAIAQPLLIRRGRVDLHRRVGRLSYALLPIIALGFWLIMVDGQMRKREPALILALAFDGGMFFFLVGMGLWHRKRRAWHSRFMMLSLLPFLNPTLGRLLSPPVAVPVGPLLLIALWMWSRRQGLEARPFAIALAAFVGGLATLVGVMAGFPEVPEWLWEQLVGS